MHTKFRKLSTAIGTAVIAAIMTPGTLLAQTDDQASWIGLPSAAAPGKPVSLQFRREIKLARVPGKLRIHISADNRFVLYVNGARIAAGPARGDLTHWRYETIDLAPALKRGANVIAVQVWSDGPFAPAAQFSSGPAALMMRAEDPTFSAIIDSGQDWKVRADMSRTIDAGEPQLTQSVGPTAYFGGPPETIDAALQSHDWLQPRSAASDWSPATAQPGMAALTLVPDTLPPMRYARVPSGRLVRTTGLAAGFAATAFPQGTVTLPANTEATLLVDAGRVLAAYPRLATSGGAGATVTLTYAESLYDPADKEPPTLSRARRRYTDRATVGDGLALGLTDTFKPAGKNMFQPFWWRTWRFIEIKVRTAAEPLRLEGLETRETGYPFEQRGYFHSSDPQLDAIWQIGWKTALLDAHETYMDTAYWEQLQYIGDTRIQALLSYNVARDDRLAQQALDAFDQSRTAKGLKPSRFGANPALAGLPQAAYPSTNDVVIPPFALLWIGLQHDYWMHQQDTQVLRRTLPGTRAVLDWFRPYLQEGGILRPIPGWQFIDWRDGLNGFDAFGGNPPQSCVTTMLYLGALGEAADLEKAVGDPVRAPQLLTLAAKVRDGIQAKCWDAGRGLYSNTPGGKSFSQHANALAVLYDVAPAEQRQPIIDRIALPDGSAPVGVTPTTFYFTFYLAKALDHAGLGDRYLAILAPWRTLLKQNFTVWPEAPDPSRSDSHAWSAHPTSGLLTYVAGIQPAAAGFTAVRIMPHIGGLTSLDAAMAHPAGIIRTRYKVTPQGLTVSVDLPPAVSGTFRWNAQDHVLRPGSNRFTILAAKQAERGQGLTP